jgi:hypothetical protein
MSLFDPIGFLLMVTIASRNLMQKNWKNGLGWDDELNSELFEKWKQWLKQIQQIDDVKVSSCYETMLSRS